MAKTKRKYLKNFQLIYLIRSLIISLSLQQIIIRNGKRKESSPGWRRFWDDEDMAQDQPQAEEFGTHLPNQNLKKHPQRTSVGIC